MPRRSRYCLDVGLDTRVDPFRWARGFPDTVDDPRWGLGFLDTEADLRSVDWDTAGDRDGFGRLEAGGLGNPAGFLECLAGSDTSSDLGGRRSGSRFDCGSLDNRAGRWGTELFRVGLPAFWSWEIVLVLVASPVLGLLVLGLDTVLVPLGLPAVPRLEVLGPRGLSVRKVWARVRLLAPAAVFPP